MSRVTGSESAALVAARRCYVFGWMVAHRESAALAHKLISHANGQDHSRCLWPYSLAQSGTVDKP